MDSLTRLFNCSFNKLSYLHFRPVTDALKYFPKQRGISQYSHTAVDITRSILTTVKDPNFQEYRLLATSGSRIIAWLPDEDPGRL
jgi:hypothetical protein